MKVQNEMSTRISVDTVSAVGSMSAFRNAIRGASSAWRSQEVALRNSGNFTEAATARYRGLNKVIDLQKAKIEELRSRQEGLNISNQKQANQFLKLESQIQSANRQLSSYESQMTRARDSVRYQVSGLADLQHQMKLNESVSKSFADSLRAQGNVEKGDRAELKGLVDSLSLLEKQQSKQRFLLNQIANQSGKTSDAYKKQQIQLNETGVAIGKTKTRMEELKASLNPPRTTAWEAFKNKILDVNGAEERAAQTGQKIKGVFSGAFLGTITANILPTLQTQLQGVVTNGMAVAKVGMAMEARWKNLGVASSGVNQLQKQVAQLKTETNLSAQSVNALQNRFYGMTHSVSQTQTLTKGVASLSDQLKLSEQQANAFAGGLSRIESSGKVTSASLGRLEKQAPGLSKAIQQASGMSQKAFSDLVSSGKMTSDQFNGYLANAAKNYDTNAKAFGNSANGASHELKQTWASTQAALAKPLVKVEATGLKELQSALTNKDTQRGLQQLATGMATLAVDAAKALAVMARHQTIVKGLAVAFGSLVVTLKAMRTITSTVVLFRDFTKILESDSIAARAFGVAIRFMTGPIGIAVTAVTALVAVLVQLYKHNAKFRSFVNDIGRSLKNMGKSFVNSGKSILNSANNLHKSLARKWSNYWKQQRREQLQSDRNQERENARVQRSWNNFARNTSRELSNAWNSMRRTAQIGTRNVGRWYTQLSNNTGRVLRGMYRQHPRMFQLMYKNIEDRSRIWKDLVTGHWSNLRSDTARVASDSARLNENIFRGLYDDINNKTDGGLKKVVDSWSDHLNQIGSAISSAAKSAATAMAGLANDVLKPFKVLIDDIQGGINWILDKVGASKLGGSWSASIPTFATGTKGNPDGLKKATIGMVNDGAGSHWRELYSYKGKIGAFPNKRNFITYLPKGMSILNGEDSHKLINMMGIPHFADGVGDFFRDIINGGKDALEDVDKILKSPIEFAKETFSHFVKVNTNIKFAADLVKSVPPYIASKMAEWIKKQFQELADPGGTGVARWRPYVLRALKMLNLSESLVGKVLKQIQTESNGNPKAMGGTDGLSDGHAEGLMQVKPPTFNAYKLPGHNNIWNGFDNLLAGLNYALHRYGPSLYFLGQGHGYANGGLVQQHGIYEVAEGNNPEMIIPLSSSKRSRAYQLLSEVMAQFKHEDGASQINPNDQSYSKEDFINAQSQITELKNGIKELIELQKVQIAAIKAQGKFDPRQQNIQQAQALSMKLLQY